MKKSLFIDRPVLTVVISLIFILLGLMGYKQLQLRSAPEVFEPHLSISIDAPGSSAEFIEKNVITKLESNLQDVPYLSYMYSQSSQDGGDIDLHFTNVTPEQYLTAESQVMQEISSTNLPQSVQHVDIHHGSGSEGTQVMLLAVSSSEMNQHQLVAYVQNNIVKLLNEVPGVGDVEQHSTKDALRVSLDPKKMAQLGIDVQQVIDAVNNNDTAMPAGEVVNLQQAIPVNLNSRLNSVDQFKNIILAKQNNHLIYLKDVASIQIDNTLYAGAYTFYNGKQGVAVNILSSDQADPIALGDALHKKLESISRNLPPGMHITTIFDGANLIKKSVTEVYLTIIESIILVAFVTLLFLGRVRFALIPVITIPVCIIGTFALMWLLGFSLNMMTLLALVLGVGLVVDDAIVVLENSHRHIENGQTPYLAAITSLKQITFPVIGMTVSLFAVYIPSAFMRGKAAVFIQQFAFTLAGAVIISGFVALTLTPMMCSQLLTKVEKHGYDAFLDRFFSRLRDGYKKTLSWVLSHKLIIIFVFFILFIGGLFIFRSLPTTLIPTEYGGYVFAGVKTPDSASVSYTESVAKPVIKTLLAQPEVSGLMSFGGGNNNNRGVNFIILKSQYRSYAKTVAFANKMEDKFASVLNGRVFVTPLDVSIDDHDNSNSPGMLFFYITGNVSYQELANAAKKVSEVLKKSGMFQEVDNDMTYSSQQYQLSINKIKAAILNVPIDNINTAISTYFGGYEMSDGYQFNGVNYPVIIQLPKNQMQDMRSLNTIFVSSTDGLQVPLSRLVTAKQIINLPYRAHVNSIRAGEIDVLPKSNYTAGQVVHFMQQVVKNNLSSNLSLTYTNHVMRMLSGNSNLDLIFLLGLLFIYLILSALFESFIDPFIILLTVPLCIVGALAVLKCIGGSINVYTGIGLITLIGLVSKHGVLIVQFANEIRKKGTDLKDTILQAAAIRLRPILMTTSTMVIGALPLLFYTGIGSNSRIQLGSVIVSGLIVGTFFSLFVVPVAYIIFAKFKKDVTHEN